MCVSVTFQKKKIPVNLKWLTATKYYSPRRKYHKRNAYVGRDIIFFLLFMHILQSYKCLLGATCPNCQNTPSDSLYSLITLPSLSYKRKTMTSLSASGASSFPWIPRASLLTRLSKFPKFHSCPPPSPPLQSSSQSSLCLRVVCRADSSSQYVGSDPNFVLLEALESSGIDTSHARVTSVSSSSCSSFSLIWLFDCCALMLVSFFLRRWSNSLCSGVGKWFNFG